MKRVAFFFAGADRTGMMEAVRHGALPDSGLRGANVFAERGFQVELVSSHVLESRLPFLPVQLLQLLLVPKLARFDIVIASDGLLLGWAVSALMRAKWVYVAINSSALIRRHAPHPLRRAIMRCAWNRCAVIVCLSRQQKEDLIRFGVREALLHEIRFGADTSYFDGDPQDVGERILSIGKDLGRDYATLLKAAELAGLPLDIVASKKNLLQGVHVPENVRIRFDVPLEELKRIYADARFLVVSSLPEEADRGTDCSGQTVILEAMASGRAVVATRRAWIEEYFQEGREYLVVEPGDAEALAAAMRLLAEDGTLRERLAAEGQKAVRAHYSSRRFGEELVGLIERL